MKAQIDAHLAKNVNGFSGAELVTVNGGGNDLFMQLGGVGAAFGGGATALGAGTIAGWPDDVLAIVFGGGDAAVNAAKIAISIDPSLLKRVDALVSRKLFRSRSEIFQVAVSEQIERLDENALARECAKLDQTQERAFA